MSRSRDAGAFAERTAKMGIWPRPGPVTTQVSPDRKASASTMVSSAQSARTGDARDVARQGAEVQAHRAPSLELAQLHRGDEP